MYLGIWLSRMFLEQFLPLTAGLMVEVMGPATVDAAVEARDRRDTLERIKSAAAAAAELLPMASLEYLIFVYSRVLF